jgi:Flp pilus assembly protein TadG
VILPVLMLLVLGMIDLGRAFTFGVSTTQGARESARYASRLSVNSNVSDTTVVQRLIDASSPALQGCLPIIGTQQTCGGGTWTFTVSATPPGSTTAYSSIALAQANSISNLLLSGGRITVTANGSVALLGGYCLGQSLCLPSIGVQGQGSMEFM